DSLAPHREAVVVPINDADTIAPLREKNVQMTAQRVSEKNASNHRDETIGALPSVDRLRGHKNADARWQTQHAPTSRTKINNRRKVSASKEDGTRTTNPPGNTTSTPA